MKIRPRSRRRSCTGGLPKDPVIRRGRRDTRRTRRPNSTCRHEQPETATARNIPAFPCGASRTIGTVVMVGSSNMLQAPVNPVPGAAPGGSATATPAIAIMRIALLTIVRTTRFIRFLLCLSVATSAKQQSEMLDVHRILLSGAARSVRARRRLGGDKWADQPRDLCYETLSSARRRSGLRRMTLPTFVATSCSSRSE